MNDDKKQEIIEVLITRSQYDSDWINVASDLIANEGLTEEQLTPFNAKQLSVISDACTANKVEGCVCPLNKIMNPKFNATQMDLIKIGYSKGAKPELMEELLDPTIPYVELNFIIKGLIDGYDDMVDCYLLYTADQIAEIYAGHKDGIDYSMYMSPGIPSDMMSMIRFALTLKLCVNVYEEEGKMKVAIWA